MYGVAYAVKTLSDDRLPISMRSYLHMQVFSLFDSLFVKYVNH